jgi:hypothetical protein
LRDIQRARVAHLGLVCMLWQTTPAAALKRARATSPDVSSQPQPLPTRDLPIAVWEEHLLPLMAWKDAGRLGCTCRALNVVVREHFIGGLGTVEAKKLRAALMTFPGARELTLACSSEYWGSDGFKEGLVESLREGGRGRHLAIVRSDGGLPASGLVHMMLRGGALPSLKGVTASLEFATHRASLTEGLLGAMHELHLTVGCTQELAPQLAALGLVRQLPLLTKLELGVLKDMASDDQPVQWPAFIPPNLKTLHIKTEVGPASQTLLRALPGMLGVCGARLDRLEVIIPPWFTISGDGLGNIAEAVRYCSTTLKSFRLLAERAEGVVYVVNADAEESDEQETRLRVQWAEVLAAVSSCRELEVLFLPYIEVEPLFPLGTVFGRLTHLEIHAYAGERPPETGAMGLWELMASGGLPTLAKLRVRLEGCGWEHVEGVRTWVMPALEAVAGTLTHLDLGKWIQDSWPSDELRVAIGKLRRLKDLALTLSDNGHGHHSVAQGLVASGGDRPLPLLWRVTVGLMVTENAHLVASLLLPSVRVFVSRHPYVSGTYGRNREALLMACALRQAGGCEVDVKR